MSEAGLDLAAGADTVTRSADGIGAVVDPTAAPVAAMTEIGVGSHVETWFVPLDARSAPTADAQWSDGTKSIWFMSVKQDPATLGIGRLGVLGYDTVTDIEVNGHAGYVATLTSETTIGEFVTLAWADDGRITYVGAYGFTPDELVQVAAQLRPATTDEWATMLATSSTPDTPAPPHTTVPVTTLG